MLLLAATACGDNKEGPGPRPDSGSGSGSGFPAAPVLGAQIDRMGRPAVNTLLNHGFDPTADAGSAKNAYNADTAFGSGWIATWRAEFAKNAAILDALDTGICGNGRCELGEIPGIGSAGPVCQPDCGSAGSGSGSGNGCGNTVLYNAATPGVSDPNPASYLGLGQLLAQDEIFLNTSKGTCALYLAIEYYVANSAAGTETTCGGRTPQYDVVDFSLSMLTMGAAGFQLPAFAPKVTDGAGPHTDYLTDFPYLGAPH
jgi:hypothetical protein